MQFVDRMSRNRKLDRLIEQWIEYRDTVSRLGGQAGATPEQERQFLSLKASIAAALPSIADSHAQGSINTEAQANVRGMTDLMNSQLSLAGHLPGDDFLNRWHTHYLYLNRFKGMAQQARPAMGRAGMAAPASMPGDGYYKGSFSHRYIRPIFNNWLTRFVVRLAVVAGLVILVARVLNMDLNQAPQWGKQVANDWWGPGNASSTGTSSNTTGGRTPAGPLNAPHDTRTSVNKSTRTHQDAIDSAVRGADLADGSGGGAGPIAARKPGQKPVSGDRTVTINSGPRSTKYSPDGSNVFQPPATPGVVNDAKAVASRLVPRPVKEVFAPVTQRYGVEVTVAMVGIGLLLVAYMIFGRAR
jgi:hypothetical protein